MLNIDCFSKKLDLVLSIEIRNTCKKLLIKSEKIFVVNKHLMRQFNILVASKFLNGINLTFNL